MEVGTLANVVFTLVSVPSIDRKINMISILALVAAAPFLDVTPAGNEILSCSLRKGARETAMDPLTGNPAAIFNPRTADWSAHFRCDEGRIVGLTAIGRATVSALHFNRPLALAIRQEETPRGRFPAIWQR